MRHTAPSLIAVALIGAVLLADAGCRPDEIIAEEEAVTVPLTGARLARREALDLLGELPTVAEMDAADADPDKVSDLRDAWMEDPRMEERLVFLLAEHWMTASDSFSAYYYDYGLEPEQEYAFERSVGQEPLRLLARIIASDEHWSQAVLADYTMSTELTSKYWPQAGYPEGGTGWNPVTWTDSRPPVGVLATNGMWWRYTSTDYNSNRSRVAAISRVLTCEDLLLREVTFKNTAALLDIDDVSEMIQSEDSCLACHATVEPMAAAMFGFLWIAEHGVQEMERYHPEREPNGPEKLHVEMAYWGEPITGLEDLGWAISRDERFYSCMAETMTGLLLRRPLQSADTPDVDTVYRAFIDGDARGKALIRAVMDLPSYQAGALGPAATEDDAGREILTRTMSPQQLGSVTEALTGFRWTNDGFYQMDNDARGFRVLSGGVDGEMLTLPVAEPTLTSTLVVKRLAEAAAYHEVSEHYGDGGDTILGGTDLTVADLYYRLTATQPDADTLAAYTDLWTEINDAQGEAAAWQAVLTAMFRDPAFITY